MCEVEAATAQVRSSRGLRAVLELALALGNALNAGTPRGGAYGFRIIDGGLLKLGTIKSLDGKETLLHYLVSLCDRAVTAAAVTENLPLRDGGANASTVDARVAPLPTMTGALILQLPPLPETPVGTVTTPGGAAAPLHILSATKSFTERGAHDDSGSVTRTVAVERAVSGSIGSGASGHASDAVALRRALELGAELPALDAAARCSFGQWRAELAQLDRGIALAREQLAVRRPAFEERLARHATRIALRCTTESLVREATTNVRTDAAAAQLRRVREARAVSACSSNAEDGSAGGGGSSSRSTGSVSQFDAMLRAASSLSDAPSNRMLSINLDDPSRDASPRGGAVAASARMAGAEDAPRPTTTTLAAALAAFQDNENRDPDGGDEDGVMPPSLARLGSRASSAVSASSSSGLGTLHDTLAARHLTSTSASTVRKGDGSRTRPRRISSGPRVARAVVRASSRDIFFCNAQTGIARHRCVKR